jgi:hypothetical protein
LEGVEHGVEADAVPDGLVGVGPEAAEQLGLVVVVEGVHDFVGVAHKAVHGVDRQAVLGFQGLMPSVNEVL